MTRRLEPLILPLLATSAGIVVAGLTVGLLYGFDTVVPAIEAAGRGAAGSPTQVAATLSAAIPIVLVGLATALSFRAGIFNVGAPGQYVMGALLAGTIAPVLPGPGWVVVVLTLATGAVSGAAWGAISASLVRFVGLNVLVITLILNYLAEGIASLAANKLVRDPTGGGLAATPRIDVEDRLPILFEHTNLHAGVLVVPLVILAAWWVFRYTTAGHRLTLFGKNPLFGEFSGTPRVAFEGRIIAISGAIAGLAGAIQVLGVFNRYLDGAIGGPASAAWVGITLAILVRRGTISLVWGGLFLAALETGLAGAGRDTGVPVQLAAIVQAAILLVVAIAATRETTITRAARAPRVGEHDGMPN